MSCCSGIGAVCFGVKGLFFRYEKRVIVGVKGRVSRWSGVERSVGCVQLHSFPLMFQFMQFLEDVWSILIMGEVLFNLRLSELLISLEEHMWVASSWRSMFSQSLTLSKDGRMEKSLMIQVKRGLRIKVISRFKLCHVWRFGRRPMGNK